MNNRKMKRETVSHIVYTLFILLVSFTGFGQNNYAGDRKFLQDVKNQVDIPGFDGKEIVRLLKIGHEPAVVTRDAVFRSVNGKWKKTVTATPLALATTGSDGKIWLVAQKSIIDFETNRQIELPYEIQADTVLSFFPCAEQVFLLGTENGLWVYDGSWKFQSETRGIKIRSIDRDINHKYWLATNNGLWTGKPGNWINLDDQLMSKGHEYTYFAVYATGDGVIFSSAKGVGFIAENGDNWFKSGKDGLPYGPVTCIRLHSGTLWLGTDNGAIRKSSQWNYYQGKRWLTDNQVVDILSLDENKTWVATKTGISEIEKKVISFEEKSQHYVNIIEQRHVRRGLVNDSRLKKAGDCSTSFMVNEDNDGLWTSLYLAAECFRYSVTHDSSAHVHARRTFEALERLERVTGIAGYPARSYALATDSVLQSRSPHPKKWHLSPDGKWQWLDDTSSDEICGHIFSIAVFYNLVASADEKKRAAGLMERIVNHIVDNNFHLIDFDGKPTRWGVWNPDSLNDSPRWAYERGLNSLQILSHLKVAGVITGNSRFDSAFHSLATKHGYLQNLLQAKKAEPFENSHSDDILTYLPYYTYFQFGKKDEATCFFTESLERSWKLSEPEYNPAWNIMASAALQKDCGLETALQQLREYPLDLVNWTMLNSHRWDFIPDPMVDRSGKVQAITPLPPSESTVSKWNTNPRQPDSGDNGFSEEDGTFFLLPYWMARFHGF